MENESKHAYLTEAQRRENPRLDEKYTPSEGDE